MNVSQKSPYSAPALEKGLDILEFLAGERFSNSQVDIAKALGRSQGEIYRMLACLEERGYVLKEPNTGNYRLSLRLYQLAHRQSSTMLLRHAAMLPLDALADETGQSCHLSVRQGGGLVVLIKRAGNTCAWRWARAPRAAAEPVCIRQGAVKSNAGRSCTAGVGKRKTLWEFVDGSSKVTAEDPGRRP